MIYQHKYKKSWIKRQWNGAPRHKRSFFLATPTFLCSIRCAVGYTRVENEGSVSTSAPQHVWERNNKKKRAQRTILWFVSVAPRATLSSSNIWPTSQTISTSRVQQSRASQTCLPLQFAQSNLFYRQRARFSVFFSLDGNGFHRTARRQTAVVYSPQLGWFTMRWALNGFSWWPISFRSHFSRLRAPCAGDGKRTDPSTLTDNAPALEKNPKTKRQTHLSESNRSVVSEHNKHCITFANRISKPRALRNGSCVTSEDAALHRIKELVVSTGLCQLSKNPVNYTQQKYMPGPKPHKLSKALIVLVCRAASLTLGCTGSENYAKLRLKSLQDR